MQKQFRFDVRVDVKDVNGMLVATSPDVPMWIASRDEGQLRALGIEGIESMRAHLATAS